MAKYEKKATSAPADAWGQERERARCGSCRTTPVYAAMLEQLDAAIGRVLAAVEKNGLTEKTIVVFMSDNGGLSTSEGASHLESPAARRQRLALRRRRARADDRRRARRDEARQHLRRAGDQHRLLSHAAATRGPAFEAGAASRWRELPAAAQRRGDARAASRSSGTTRTTPTRAGAPHGAIRDGDWKLIEWYEDGALELYNIPQDIGEKNDLAAQQPEKVKALHEKLVAWRKEVGALMPTPNPEFDPKK